MLELLAPAGGKEALIAAVRSGADAVYLGAGNFNARRGAENFSGEALGEAVRFCHLRGVRVYLTLNTLLGDAELSDAAALAREANALGVDAVLVQDLGVAAVLRRTVPDLPLHASTQMTVHSLDGVRAVADLGMTRAVLSRELSRDAIAHICAHSPIEIEVFVHGALCMCYSGQCFFSSAIGGRSGNRGMCAQPCRLLYGWGDRADRPLLSLKDMNLSAYLSELQDMGVACAKIEGRLKRPEYVAIVTRIYAAALRERRAPTPEELKELRAAFSRQGFTDGYYRGKTGREMFGVHEKEPLPEALFADARRQIAQDAQTVPVRFSARVGRDVPVSVTAEDADGHCVTVSAPAPEAALHRALTREQLASQLSKTGGTVYRCEGVAASVEDGLSLPVSRLNALRREALDALSEARMAPPERRSFPYAPVSPVKSTENAPVYTVSCRYARQLTPSLLALRPESAALELDAFARDRKNAINALRLAAGQGVSPAVTLPRILWDRERADCLALLRELRAETGAEIAYAGTLAAAALAREAGFPVVRGDFGLGVYNSETAAECRRLGFSAAVVSFELRQERIAALSKALPLEELIYGRFPLMITENCIIKNRTGGCNCANENRLIDRRRMRFPVVRAYGCRNEILNAVPLYLGDKPAAYRRAGVWAARLRFTTESAGECAALLRRCQEGGSWKPEEFTRGLYFRDVE